MFTNYLKFFSKSSNPSYPKNLFKLGVEIPVFIETLFSDVSSILFSKYVLKTDCSILSFAIQLGQTSPSEA